MTLFLEKKYILMFFVICYVYYMFTETMQIIMKYVILIKTLITLIQICLKNPIS